MNWREERNLSKGKLIWNLEEIIMDGRKESEARGSNHKWEKRELRRKFEKWET